MSGQWGCKENLQVQNEEWEVKGVEVLQLFQGQRIIERIINPECEECELGDKN